MATGLVKSNRVQEVKVEITQPILPTVQQSSSASLAGKQRSILVLGPKDAAINDEAFTVLRERISGCTRLLEHADISSRLHNIEEQSQWVTKVQKVFGKVEHLIVVVHGQSSLFDSPTPFTQVVKKGGAVYLVSCNSGLDRAKIHPKWGVFYEPSTARKLAFKKEGVRVYAPRAALNAIDFTLHATDQGVFPQFDLSYTSIREGDLRFSNYAVVSTFSITKENIKDFCVPFVVYPSLLDQLLQHPLHESICTKELIKALEQALKTASFASAALILHYGVEREGFLGYVIPVLRNWKLEKSVEELKDFFEEGSELYDGLKELKEKKELRAADIKKFIEDRKNIFPLDLKAICSLSAEDTDDLVKALSEEAVGSHFFKYFFSTVDKPLPLDFVTEAVKRSLENNDVEALGSIIYYAKNLFHRDKQLPIRIQDLKAILFYACAHEEPLLVDDILASIHEAGLHEEEFKEEVLCQCIIDSTDEEFRQFILYLPRLAFSLNMNWNGVLEDLFTRVNSLVKAKIIYTFINIGHLKVSLEEDVDHKAVLIQILEKGIKDIETEEIEAYYAGWKGALEELSIKGVRVT